MESIPSTAGPEASLADGQHIDLTEDLGQQLEKIINTYQAAETNPEQEDTEEVTVVKDLDARKDQKLEKKMRKNLGVLFVVLFFSGCLPKCSIDFSLCGFPSAQSAEAKLVLNLIGV